VSAIRGVPGISAALLKPNDFAEIDPCVTPKFPLGQPEFSTGSPKVLLGSPRHRYCPAQQAHHLVICLAPVVSSYFFKDLISGRLGGCSYFTICSL
jgi:hypothetical protein